MSKYRIVQEIEAILGEGRSLDEVGVQGWGLTRAEALTALEALRARQIAVLGGDVHMVAGGTVRPDYANWSCERLPGEKAAEFTARSLDVAHTFIAGYSVGERTVLFALVPHDDLLF